MLMGRAGGVVGMPGGGPAEAATRATFSQSPHVGEGVREAREVVTGGVGEA